MEIDEDDGTQNYLVFHPIERCFKKIAGVSNNSYVYYIYYWQSKGFLMKKLTLLKHVIIALLQT